MGEAYAQIQPLAQKIAAAGGGLRDVVDLCSMSMVYRWCRDNRPEWDHRKIASEMGVSHATYYRRRERLVALTGWDLDDIPAEFTAATPPPRVAFGLT